ncbi:MAG: hypothetical protein JEZ00_01540 [Anaerolineaceae bacterium]|nr:hypothetical protein [Anaerolineaceae bacterium]
MGLDASQLDIVVAEICKNENYARMESGIVRKIALQEMSKRKNLKKVVKAARSKLHQIGTVYLGSPKPLAFDFSTIPADQKTDIEFQKTWAQPYLENHASTNERFSFLEHFYGTIFERLPEVKMITDLACGMNPLCRPWMPIAPQVEYRACDIFTDGINLINGFFDAFGYSGKANICDLTDKVPDCRDQLVFLLKTLPCLEQIQKGIGRHILSEINAHVLVVSFPSKSLGGKNKGMLEHYDAYLKSILNVETWQMQTIEFINETVYLLTRKD